MLTIPSLLKVRIESICVLSGKINFMNSLVFPMGCRVPPPVHQNSETPFSHFTQTRAYIYAHLDGLYLQGRSYDDCVKDTTVLLDKLGLVVHSEKSSFIPSQVLVIPGFIINSLTMTIQLTTEKALGLKTVCIAFCRATTLWIRGVASAIGRIFASFPGVMHGPLFYRHLEKDMFSLTAGKGKFWCSHVPFTTS